MPRAGLLLIEMASTRRRDPSHQQEMLGLVGALDVRLLWTRNVRLRSPSPGYLVSSGHLDSLAEQVADTQLDLLVIDRPVSPVQQRNLEKELSTKVIDRTGVILEIFALRARSAEGRLQVEAAQMIYLRSRLVRSWTHLERQRGGVGLMAGPGESQLEADRRALDKRLSVARKRIAAVRKARALQRRRRKKRAVRGVALIGYTNAGKSTLFTRLTGKNVLIADMPFATLDPHVSEITLARGRHRLGLVDTVGFISDLPPSLIAAFRATIEQVMEADLLIHVRDVSHPCAAEQAKDVHTVLRRLETETALPTPPLLEVWNKTDMLTGPPPFETTGAIRISALTGDGMSTLLKSIETHVFTTCPH